MSPDPVNTSPGVAAVLRELDSVHRTIQETKSDVRRDLTEHREVVKVEMHDFREEVNGKLDEIVAEARKTNGRLRKAELWLAGVKGLGSIAILLTPFVLFYLNSR